jgi:trehalose/maltose hydrolase-like predicted phosphorylase
MAGTIDLLQRGYTGLEARGDSLKLDPALPEPLQGVEFSLHYRQSWNIDVAIGDGDLRVTVPPSDSGPIAIECCGSREQVDPGESFRGRYA